MNPLYPPSYPKTLAYAVHKLAGYSTSVVKLRCNQNSAAKAGDVISFDLPYNALVDMDSLRVCFNLRNAGASTTGLELVHRGWGPDDQFFLR